MGRTPCCEKNGLKKGPWTQEEDQKLIDYIQKNGSGNWRTLPKKAGLERCGKSCRLRWTNYLRPDIKRGRFSFEEEETIIQLHSILGNKWSAIAARLPGRTDNEIKNYWNTHIRKRLLRMGIDPVTHSPRLDLLDLSSVLTTSVNNNNHNSLMNVSRVLGFHQSLVQNYPELLRLASSLFPSTCHASQDSSFLLQNLQQQQQNQLQSFNNNLDHDQLPPLTQTSQVQEIPTFSDSGQDFQMNNWQWENNGVISSYNNYDVVPPPEFSNNYECYDHQPAVGLDHRCLPLSENYSNFHDQSYNNNSSSSSNFGFQSVWSNISTPSSSPTPLNSNSTYVSSSDNEREISHCSNLMKFEIPDLLDVNEFM